MKTKLMLIFALLATLMGCQTAPQMPAGWQETTGDGKFSVYLPGKPQESTKTVTTGIGPLELHLFVLDKDESRYIVVYNDFPMDLQKAGAVDTVLDSSSKGVVKGFGGKLISEKKITLQGNPGRELKIASASGKRLLRCRNYVVGSRLYYVEISVPNSEYDSKDTLAFLDSFRVK